MNLVRFCVKDYTVFLNIVLEHNNFLRIQNIREIIVIIHSETYLDRLPSLGSKLDGTSRFEKLFYMTWLLISQGVATATKYVNRFSNWAACMRAHSFI